MSEATNDCITCNVGFYYLADDGVEVADDMGASLDP